MPTVKKLEELLKRIAEELRDLINTRYTGKLTIEIHLNHGGIGSAFLNSAKQMI